MDDWNTKKMDFELFQTLALFFPNIPLFQHSTIPPFHTL